MKITNIALHAVLAVIGTASCASAKGFFRGSVKEKEDERRWTMGDQVHRKYLDKCADGRGSCAPTETCGAYIDSHEAMAGQTLSDALDANGFDMNILDNAAYMRACYEVAKTADACVGCQGYELEGSFTKTDEVGMVHIPGCMNMSPGDCTKYATQILDDHKDWFPADAKLKGDHRQIVSQHEQWYWMLALPVDGNKEGSSYGPTAGWPTDTLDTNELVNQEVKGLAGGCLVHYPFLWCLAINTGRNAETQCDQLAPFDCTGGSGAKGCMTVGECCAHINGDETNEALYIWPDINGNKLQCYAWPIGGESETMPTGDGGGTKPTGTGHGGTGATDSGFGGNVLRFIMHHDHSRVTHPAIIINRKGSVIEADGGISIMYDEKNIHKWDQDYDHLDKFMKDQGKGIPVIHKDSLMKSKYYDVAEANNAWWKQDQGGPFVAGSGYAPGKGTDAAQYDGTQPS